MKISQDHNKNIFVSVGMFFAILIFPLIFVSLFMFLSDKFSFSNFYDIGISSSGNNWISILGALSTIIVAFNVVQWEIAKLLDSSTIALMDLPEEYESEKNQNTLRKASKSIIYFIISVVLGVMLLFTVGLIILSSLSQNGKDVPTSLISTALYLVCAFSLFLSLDKFDRVNSILVPIPIGRNLSTNTNRQLVDRARFYVVTWRMLLFIFLFILYSLVNSSVAHVFYLILVVFFVNKCVRFFIRQIFFTPNGFNLIASLFFSIISSLAVFLFALFPLLDARDNKVSYLGGLNLPGIIVDISNSTLFAIILFSIIYLLFLLDLVSSQNLFRPTFLRARSILEFSRDYSLIELNAYGLVAACISLLLTQLIIFSESLQSENHRGIVLGILIWIPHILFSIIWLPTNKIQLFGSYKSSVFDIVVSLLQSIFVGLMSNLLTFQLLLDKKITGNSALALLLLSIILSVTYSFSGEYKKYRFKEYFDNKYILRSIRTARQLIAEEDVFNKIFQGRDFK